jgi:hypothetical protein
VISSLPEALEWAMRTIHKAADTVSGPATELLDLTEPDPLENRPACPIRLPRFLEAKDYCEYSGWYHTDQTLPGEYFLPDVARPASQLQSRLDFTYLFDDSVANPDHERLAKGVQIRGEDQDLRPSAKLSQAADAVIRIDSSPQLRAALER